MTEEFRQPAPLLVATTAAVGMDALIFDLATGDVLRRPVCAWATYMLASGGHIVTGLVHPQGFYTQLESLFRLYAEYGEWIFWRYVRSTDPLPPPDEIADGWKSAQEHQQIYDEALGWSCLSE